MKNKVSFVIEDVKYEDVVLGKITVTIETEVSEAIGMSYVGLITEAFSELGKTLNNLK